MTERRQKSSSVTIFDVAKEAGVSYSTVSRVANNYEYVRPSTRKKVEEAMQKLGYVANLKARSLAGGRSQVVGLLVYDLESSYQVEIVRGIDAELSSSDYDLMLSTTHERPVKESAYVDRLTRGLADGLLIVLPHSPQGYIDRLVEQEFPFVLIDYRDDQHAVSTVTVSNRQGAYDATQYLLELGHRRIGFIMGRLHQSSASERFNGYLAALNDYGVAVHDELVRQGDFLEQTGYMCGVELLSLPERPTAILASSDAMAFGVMQAAQEAGLNIPEDLSLVGFDDIPEASYVRPALTTVRQPLNEMGRVGSRILMQHIEDPGLEPQHVQLKTELIIRGSCKPV